MLNSRPANIVARYSRVMCVYFLFERLVSISLFTIHHHHHWNGLDNIVAVGAGPRCHVPLNDSANANANVRESIQFPPPPTDLLSTPPREILNPVFKNLLHQPNTGSHRPNFLHVLSLVLSLYTYQPKLLRSLLLLHQEASLQALICITFIHITSRKTFR